MQTARITKKYQHNIQQLVSSEEKANEALKSSPVKRDSSKKKVVTESVAKAHDSRRMSGETTLVEVSHVDTVFRIDPPPRGLPTTETSSSQVPVDPPETAAPSTADSAGQQAQAQQPEQAEQEKKQKAAADAAEKILSQQQKEQEEAEKKKQEEQKKLADGVRLKHTGLQSFKDVVVRSANRVERKMTRSQTDVYNTVRRGIHHMEESPGGEAAIHAARHVREGVSSSKGINKRRVEINESSGQLQDDIRKLNAKTASEKSEIDELRSDTDNTLLQNQYETMMLKLDKETPADGLKKISDFSQGKGRNPFKDGKVNAEAKAASALGHAATELGKGTDQVKEPEPLATPSQATSKILDEMASTKTLSDIDNMHDFASVHASLVKENDAEAKAMEAASQSVKAQADDKWHQTQAAIKAREEPLAAKDSKVFQRKNWEKIYAASTDRPHKIVAGRMHLLHPDEPSTGNYGAQGVPRKHPSP